MKMFSLRYVLPVMLLAILAGGCKRVFDIKPGTELDSSQMYLNVYDADAAVMAIYGKFMALSDRYIILNELRGDLLEYTVNADENLRQISTHQVKADNPYASPRPFYELILQCNDVLKNFAIMKQKNLMKEGEYDQRFSDIATLRSFLYLQLGIHYGDEVRYVTDALETVDAVKDESRFPKVKFTVLIDSLISFTEKITFKNPYPTGTTLNILLDGHPTTTMFINKKILLGDLYLWKGNYRQAAIYFREVLETATVGAQGETYYSQYKLGWTGNHNHYVSYTRAGDASSLNFADGWRVIFDRPYDAGYSREWIWALPYDSRFAPDNPLIKLFSPIGGSYLVKPSQAIIDNWNSQRQRPVAVAGSANGIPYDARGPLSVRLIGDQPVVMKFLYNYINYATMLPVNPLTKNGKWFLLRQTHLHTRFAEAANRDGYHKLAYGFINAGIRGAYPVPANTPNVTPYQNTLAYPAPYNFDARMGDIPNYRSDWYRQIGIRNRALLLDDEVPAGADSLTYVENSIINENALENAFEGTRWPDLLRVALRRNDPAFLADKIYQKLLKDGVPDAAAVKAKLMNKENWYLPFKL
ncbi:RagB/SusD family protein [Paraflavitalea sp. CAU 1676]|uniref:RagB/SusD family protein n=1 Tax=Paraflavitalea sp. CAU 1676 TaxID=3032598 RepID=UPI0023DC171D|nr:RagB/SusD family protein [Paraflavitalea sp. CAU 1676]MDF2192895.1 RagB/SusD family protein [Paraflavitalea sp. CAU 1676]